MEKKLGYIGLGKMGLNMVERLTEKGYAITAYDPSSDAREKAKGIRAQTTETVADLIEKLSAPRTVWLMVPHMAVDDVLCELVPLLTEGDTVIDGGNSHYKNTLRRAKELEEKKIGFLDVGVSGGPSGAHTGACVMVGGARKLFDEYEDLFRDIAVEDGYGYMGRSGAGHFVKMVHNGIEYGMMQAIGEGFAVLKNSDFQLNLTEVTRIYNHQSVITSRLTQWLQKAFEDHGEELADISGEIAHSGEGLWTVETAKNIGVPVPIIEGALKFREESRNNPSYTGQVVSALRNQFGGHAVDRK